jgi:hypothetical protein
MRKVILTRTQFESIQKIFENFDYVDQFEIVQESPSGIGPNTIIKFDSTVSNHEYDITDVSNW